MMTLNHLSRIILLVAIICFARSLDAQINSYWLERAELPLARQEAPSELLDGRIYFTGGILNNGQVGTRSEYFDPLTNNWTLISPLPAPRHHTSLTELGGKLYAAGGYLTLGAQWQMVNTLFEYDPNSNSWSQMASLSAFRAEHAEVGYDGKIFLFGGRGSNGLDVNTTAIYDPNTDSWSTGSPSTISRNHHAAVVIDSLIYVVGGRLNAFNTGALQSYSPSSNIWKSLSSMPTPRSGIAAAALGGKLYVFGGEIPGIFETVEQYDPAADTWTLLAPMKTPRHGMGAITVGDTVFIIGGAITAGFGAVATNEGFVLGTCRDSDADGFGDPNFPENTCPDDNCPNLYNPDQADNDSDGVGNICCCQDLAGNVDVDPVDITDIADLTVLIDHLFINFTPIGCPAEANIDGDAGGVVDIADLTFLIDHLFINFPATAVCQ